MAAIQSNYQVPNLWGQTKNLGNFLKFVWCLSNFFGGIHSVFTHQKKTTNRTSFHYSTCTFSPLPTPGPSQSSPLHDPCSCSPRSLWRPGPANTTSGRWLPGKPWKWHSHFVKLKIGPKWNCSPKRRGSLISQVHWTCLLFAICCRLRGNLNPWVGFIMVTKKLPKEKSGRRNSGCFFFLILKKGITSHLKRWGHPILAADMWQNVTSLSSLHYPVCWKLCRTGFCVRFGAFFEKSHLAQQNFRLPGTA